MGWRNGALCNSDALNMLAAEVRKELTAVEREKRKPHPMLVAYLATLAAIESLELVLEAYHGCSPFPGVSERELDPLNQEPIDALRAMAAALGNAHGDDTVSKFQAMIEETYIEGN